jgi:hypothetical protein
MRAAISVPGCAAVLETYVKPPPLRLDCVYCGCDELMMLCLKAGFNSRIEKWSEYADWGPGPLTPAGEGIVVALNGST